MSPSLSPFWSGAAQLSGRIDLMAYASGPGALASLAQRSLSELCTVGVPPAHAWALISTPSLVEPGAYLLLGDDDYPGALAPLPFAPPVLFLWGERALLERPGLAIVGARRCTEQGRRFAAQLARAVSDAGGVVISGLAWGIDEAAHEASLRNTIAVLGQGFRTLSGRSAALADRIVTAGGLVLSEFAPAVPATRITFPQRNRVIAGLARATAVIEAAERSGALITARLATEYGREVLAVPGHPSSPTAHGCLDLIASGAGLLRRVDDGLEVIGLAKAPRAAPTDPLLAALDDIPGFDQLLERLNEAPHLLARRLAELELQGLVQRLPGDRFARVGA
ncbi:MAG: DNA-protecting protein DprA [Deltaproteobacteria bacterium]|jgi:DNA processing protein|nr:DNA-protecting protein DprA [Deltaproteobacteria bacterium]